MQNGMTIDRSEFKLALTQYVAATGRDLAYATNRACKNIAFEAIKFVKIGGKEVFTKLSEYEPLVGWLINKMKKEGTLPKFTPTRARAIARNNIMAGTTAIDPYHEYAAKMILARRGHVGFLRGFFLRIARQFQSAVPGGSRTGGAKNVERITPTVKLATPSNLTVDFGASYQFKHDTTEGGKPVDTSKVDAMLAAAIDPAVTATRMDMIQYVEKILNQNAARISA